MRLRRSGIQLKTPEQFVLMRRAGLVVAQTLQALREAIRPGVSTADLDAIAAAAIRDAGAVPSFLGYQGYPATICTSVNEVIVHGIPSTDTILRDGDVISIDCGAIVDGWHGDAAFSVGVGEIGAAGQAMLDACEAALWAGIAQAVPGNRLSDISHAVQASVEEAGRYGLIEEYTGHGIGTAMHMDPPVPNFGPPGLGPRLCTGMALAIEPMITRGTRENAELADGWTVVTADGSRAAHFEHTVAITPDGPWILTSLQDQHLLREVPGHPGPGSVPETLGRVPETLWSPELAQRPERPEQSPPSSPQPPAEVPDAR
jgi:methionyl aminopeptidase